MSRRNRTSWAPPRRTTIVVSSALTARARGCSTSATSVCRNCAPSAPSIARWSQVSVSPDDRRRRRPPRRRPTGSSFTEPTARIATCGGLRTAVNCSTPNIPRFEIVNVPPSRSARFSLLSRARPTRSARARAISCTVRRSASRITGTTRPCGAATAIPTWAPGMTLDRPRPLNVALTGGWRMSATAASFTSTSFTVGFASPSAIARRASPAARAPRSCPPRRPSWKTGAVQASVRRRAIVLRTEVSWTTSTSAGAATRDGSLRCRQQPARRARSTSSARIRPSGPVPVIEARSTPRSRAIRRASGLRLDDARRARRRGRLGDTRALPRRRWRGVGGSVPRGVACGRLGSLGLGDGSASLAGVRLGRRGSAPFVVDHGDGGSDLHLALRDDDLARSPSTSDSTSWVTLSVSSS